jgi:hypothetical protein
LVEEVPGCAYNWCKGRTNQVLIRKAVQCAGRGGASRSPVTPSIGPFLETRRCPETYLGPKCVAHILRVFPAYHIVKASVRNE